MVAAPSEETAAAGVAEQVRVLINEIAGLDVVREVLQHYDVRTTAVDFVEIGGDFADESAKRLAKLLAEKAELVRKMKAQIERTAGDYKPQKHTRMSKDCISLDFQTGKWTSRDEFATDRATGQQVGDYYNFSANSDFFGLNVSAEFNQSAHLLPIGSIDDVTDMPRPADISSGAVDAVNRLSALCHTLELAKLFDAELRGRTMTYFAHVTGVFRGFPAVHFNRQPDWDPLLRPWYLAATGSTIRSKRYVYLIDGSERLVGDSRENGMCMPTYLDRIIGAVRSMASQRMTSSDWFNIVLMIPGAESGTTLQVGFPFRMYPGLNTLIATFGAAGQPLVPASADNVQSALDWLQNLGAKAASTMRAVNDTSCRTSASYGTAEPRARFSNWNAGLLRGVELVRAHRVANTSGCSLGDECETIFVLYSASFSSDEVALPWLSEVTTELQIRVFTFGLGQRVDVRAIQRVACSGNGVHTLVNEGGGDLDQQHTIFARFSQHQVQLATPQYTKPYMDALGLGLVITVSIACYDPADPSHLIGVAATDILLSELDFVKSRNTLHSYAYLMDTQGSLLLHPFARADTMADQSVMRLEFALRLNGSTELDVDGIVTAMLTRPSGTILIDVPSLFPAGIPTEQGPFEGTVPMRWKGKLHYRAIYDQPRAEATAAGAALPVLHFAFFEASDAQHSLVQRAGVPAAPICEKAQYRTILPDETEARRTAVHPICCGVGTRDASTARTTDVGCRSTLPAEMDIARIGCYLSRCWASNAAMTAGVHTLHFSSLSGFVWEWGTASVFEAMTGREILYERTVGFVMGVQHEPWFLRAMADPSRAHVARNDSRLIRCTKTAHTCSPAFARRLVMSTVIMSPSTSAPLGVLMLETDASALFRSPSSLCANTTAVANRSRCFVIDQHAFVLFPESDGSTALNFRPMRDVQPCLMLRLIETGAFSTYASVADRCPLYRINRSHAWPAFNEHFIAIAVAGTNLVMVTLSAATATARCSMRPSDLCPPRSWSPFTGTRSMPAFLQDSRLELFRSEISATCSMAASEYASFLAIVLLPVVVYMYRVYSRLRKRRRKRASATSAPNRQETKPGAEVHESPSHLTPGEERVAREISKRTEICRPDVHPHLHTLLPILVRPGASVPVSIWNPLAVPLEFSLAVDNPAFFELSLPSATIRSMDPALSARPFYGVGGGLQASGEGEASAPTVDTMVSPHVQLAAIAVDGTSEPPASKASLSGLSIVIGGKAIATVRVTFRQPAPNTAASAKLTASAPGCAPRVYSLKGLANRNSTAAVANPVHMRMLARRVHGSFLKLVRKFHERTHPYKRRLFWTLQRNGMSLSWEEFDQDETRLRMASLFLNDLLCGESMQRDGFRWYQINIYWIMASRTYPRIMRLIILLHCILVFFEPTIKLPDDPRAAWKSVLGSSRYDWQLCVEVACCAFYVVHACLSLLQTSPRVYLRHNRPQLIFLLCTFGICADVAFAGMLATRGTYWDAGYYRFSRPMRPWLLIPHWKGLRVECDKVFSNAPIVLDIVAMIGFCLTVLALMVEQVYRGADSPDDMFLGFWNTIRTLYAFSSSDNHNAVMAAAYGEKRWIVVFFVLAYVMIGLVLMSFATSLLFDGYISHQRATAAHEREESQKLLFATFALLVTDPANQEQKAQRTERWDGEADQQQMTKEQWVAVYNIIRPEAGTADVAAAPSEAEFLFQLIDDDESGKLDIHEFFKLITVSKVKIVPVASNEAQTPPPPLLSLNV